MSPKRRNQATGSGPAKRTKVSTDDGDESEDESGLPSSSVLRLYDQDKVYRLLEPGPVVLVTTSLNGVHNVMTMGFHMVVQHSEPALVAGIIGPWDHSYKALSKTKECVICIPGADLAQKVVDIGNCKGDEVDKFDKFGLTAVRAGEVGAPLIEECLASIECRVHDKAMERKYHMWIFEAIGAWVNEEREEKRTMHHKGIGNFALDGEEIDLRDRMLLWKEYQDD
ncbi:hypothetical protein AURDEDRAFT_173988 [Auricularia subglabra TFB-10046 SS5]|uniref:Flavin reductase like domain-containing protein n=1 Tax=Auricularia subglabra (strain TFB-10046 / SS5) TaxID=717982 RepID=J0LGM7_AURST|nr:hypothetical protein AURDEDRAFT_173988 [Auricularia subglabra TFB-10046 SS5]